MNSITTSQLKYFLSSPSHFLTLFSRCVHFVMVNYWTLYGVAGELAMEAKASKLEEVLHSKRREE